MVCIANVKKKLKAYVRKRVRAHFWIVYTLENDMIVIDVHKRKWKHWKLRQSVAVHIYFILPSIQNTKYEACILLKKNFCSILLLFCIWFAIREVTRAQQFLFTMQLIQIYFVIFLFLFSQQNCVL